MLFMHDTRTSLNLVAVTTAAILKDKRNSCSAHAAQHCDPTTWLSVTPDAGLSDSPVGAMAPGPEVQRSEPMNLPPQA